MSPSEAENSLINDTIGPSESLRRIGLRHAIARNPDHDEGAAEPLDHQWRNKSAAVSADIDNQRLLSNLREVKLGEFIQAGLAHVGNMEVTDFAIGFLAHVIDVLLHPRQVIKRRFVSRWNYGDVARAVVAWLRIDSQNHLLVGGADQRVVNIRQASKPACRLLRGCNRRPSRLRRCAVSGDRVCLSQFSPGKIRSIR